LSNAIKYTPAGGAIGLDTGQTDNSVWIRIRDTGPGISPTDRARIFEAFFRGQQAGRFPQGLGLGLTIARELVEAHGGRLNLDSREGVGSAFTITLPV
ncbi:MAG: ATP-binding protein, partial [Anaerolineales bacterium]|nr:ATP-binding protein [Anaerolineales bacterium]